MDQREKILKVYDQVMDHIYDALHSADAALRPTIEELVENATEIAHKAKDLSKEDAQELSRYLKRDINHALHSMHKNGQELKDWISFDLELIEDRFIDIISKAADSTWLDLRNFEQSTHARTLYKTGEITSPGHLYCIKCNQTMQFKKSAHIPPCPKCHATEFSRQPAP